MRWTLALPLLSAPLLAAVAFAAPVSAADACEQANPCEWVVAVDSNGFYESQWNWTAGDWLKITVSNDDDAAHTVTLQGAGISVQAAGLQDASSAPFQLSAGTYTLSDQPTGDTAKATVITGDVVAYEAGLTDAGTSAKGRIPGFELPLALAGLAAVAFVARRR